MKVMGFSKKVGIKNANLVEFRLHSRFVLGRWRYFAYFLYFLATLAVSHFLEGWIDEVWIRAVDKGIITLVGLFTILLLYLFNYLIAVQRIET